MRRSTPIVLLALAALSFTLAPFAARAASPAEGTLSAPASTKPGAASALTYTGGPAVGASIFQGTAHTVCGNPSTAPAGVCDTFLLHLNIPSDYWSRNASAVSGRLEVTIDWSDQPGAETQDVDLIITTPSGDQVGGAETDNIASGIPSETASIAVPDRGDYRVIAVGIVGGVATYEGTVRLVLTSPTGLNTVLSRAIQFSPATVVSPTLFGGEPGINADPSGGNRWWIDWPISSRSHMGAVMRSTDGGDTFRMMTDPDCPERRQPGCLTSGGGDTEISLSKNGVVYFANQESLANQAASVSPDHGVTWPADRSHAITQLDITSDRQWLTVYNDDVAYLAASAVGGVSLVRTEDGGRTWNSFAHPVVADAAGPSAPMVVDATGGKNDGVLYMLSRAAGLSISVSRDRGETFKRFPDPSVSGDTSGPCNGCSPDPLLIPWMTMDRAGNLYVAWSDSSDHAVYVTTMLASSPKNAGDKLGSTWTKPARVSAPPARSTVFSQLIAGDPGRIAVAFQGADSAFVSDNVPKGTPWKIYAAFSADALCQWDASCKGSGPAFLQVPVSDRVNHYNEICVSGLACTTNGKDRNLLDFFDIGMDNDGRVGIVWSDNNNAIVDNASSVMFAKVSNGPSLLASKPSFRTALAHGSASARKNDALWPVNARDGAPASPQNHPALDLTGSSLRSVGDDFVITMSLVSTENIPQALASAGYSHDQVKYVTRWHHGKDLYFVAAVVDGAGTARYYGGRVDGNDHLPSPWGPGTAYGTIYARDFDVAGSVAGQTMTLRVPRSAVGSPKDGERLFSVQSFAMVAPLDQLQNIYVQPDTIDATPPFDVRLGAAAVPPPTVGGVKKTRPAPRDLPATGASDAGSLLGVLFLAGAAATWRLGARTRKDLA